MERHIPPPAMKKKKKIKTLRKVHNISELEIDFKYRLKSIKIYNTNLNPKMFLTLMFNKYLKN